MIGSRSARWLGALGVMLGVCSPGLRGCTHGCDEEPPPARAYVVAESPDPTWVEGSSRLELEDDRLTISYETLDGSTWQAVYRRVLDRAVDGAEWKLVYELQ